MLPWVPKRVRFNGSSFDGQPQARAIPQLLPLANVATTSAQAVAITSAQAGKSGLLSGLDDSDENQNVHQVDDRTDIVVEQGPSSNDDTETNHDVQLVENGQVSIIVEQEPQSNNHSEANQNVDRVEDSDGKVDAVTYSAQVRMNTQMMAAIEKMRKDIDKMAKERDFFKLKYSTVLDQLSFLKKKVGKKNAEDEDNAQNENVDPNRNTDN